jgi:hypothetical protein
MGAGTSALHLEPVVIRSIRCSDNFGTEYDIDTNHGHVALECREYRLHEFVKITWVCNARNVKAEATYWVIEDMTEQRSLTSFVKRFFDDVLEVDAFRNAVEPAGRNVDIKPYDACGERMILRLEDDGDLAMLYSDFIHPTRNQDRISIRYR